MEHVFSNNDGLLKNESASRSNAQPQQQGSLGQAVQMAAVKPGALTSANIAQLQKTLGNKAVTQLMSRLPLQRAKGPEEEEPLQGKFQAVQCKSPEEEEPLQGKFAPVQKSAAPEEDELQS